MRLPPALVCALLVCALVWPGCKKEAPPAAPAPVAPVKRAPVEPIPRTLRELCEQRAVGVKRAPRKSRPDDTPVELPPIAGEPGVSDAERRLQAAKALDALRARLKLDPKNADLYLQIGWVYLRTLENPSTAAGYLCRAMLLEPNTPSYRYEVLAGWMRPGEETTLELALKPGFRTLPWRDTLEQARGFKGIDDVQRAQAFMEALHAQSIIRYSRTLPRRRIRRAIEDLPAFLVKWLDEGTPANGQAEVPTIVVSVGRKHRRRVQHLLDRSGDTVPEQVWTVEGPGPRWLLHGRDLSALAPVLAEAARRLKGVRIGVSVRQGDRQIYLVGNLDHVAFDMRAVAAKPTSRLVNDLVLPPIPQ